MMNMKKHVMLKRSIFLLGDSPTSILNLLDNLFAEFFPLFFFQDNHIISRLTMYWSLVFE